MRQKKSCWEIADELKQIYTQEVIDEWLEMLTDEPESNFLAVVNNFGDTYHLPFTFVDFEPNDDGEQYIWTIETVPSAQVIMQLYRAEAGSSHAITGWKLADDYFVTLWHENYVPYEMLVHTKVEDLMHPTIYGADFDIETGEVVSTIPGLDTLEDYFKMVYICRNAGTVVRDDC